MKLLPSSNVFHSSGVQEKVSFNIAQSAKMFDILSDKLYSDKPRAIERELSTNAVDSHSNAHATHIPYDVHLPNVAEPHYSIRDYGTGISPEDMQTVYNGYGVSDKVHSNNLIGCLGLGSKSPFSYTNSFAVTSYFGGQKHMYVCTKGADGIPDLNYMGSEDTDEPTGLEVMFSVKSYDCYMFEHAAKQIYPYFKHRPRFTGAFVEIGEPDYIESGETWGLTKQQSQAIMGGVAYPIEHKFFSKFTNSWEIGNEKDNPEVILLKSGIDIYCEIGEVEFTPSREALQYTKATIANIKSRLEDALIDIDRKVNQEIQNCKTLWQARVTYQELLFSKFSTFSKLLSCRNIQWNGQPLSLHTDLTDDFKDVELIEFRDVDKKNPKRFGPNKVTVSHKVGFILKDINRGAFSICNRLVKDGTYKSLYLLSGDPQQIADFLKKLGDPAFTLASSYPRVRNSSNYVKRDDVMILSPDRRGEKTIKGSEYWLPGDDEVCMDEGGCYIPISSYKVALNGEDCCRTPDDLMSIINAMKSLKIDIPIIFGAKTKVVNIFKKHDEWTNFIDYAKQQILDYIEANNLAEHYANLNYLANNGKVSSYKTLVKESQVAPIVGGDLESLITKIDELYESRPYQSVINSINGIKDRLGISLSVGTVKHDLTADFKALEDKYKILAFLSNAYYAQTATIVVEYLNKEN